MPRPDPSQGVRSRRRGRQERGSALLLVPVGFVIVIILASFSLNSALTFLARQELERAASAAANDAVSAIGRDAFYDEGSYLVDPRAVDEMVNDAIGARLHDSVLDVRVVTRVVDEDTVVITTSGRPRVAAWRILPWVGERISVTVQASAAHR